MSLTERKRLKDEDTREASRKGPLRLRCIGFCGVDESFADPDKHDWPSYVEWGVLFRPEKEGSPRFPKGDWIERFVKDKRHMAAHLCSSRCQEFLDGDFSFVRSIHEELGFKRFQINATKANNFDSSALRIEHVHNIVNAANELPDAEFIVQRNDETKFIWDSLERMPAVPANISFLFDASVGRGIVVNEFRKPQLEGAGFGYAGGLKPENVENVLRGIARAVPEDAKVWIDMESGIRNSGDDSFAPERAWAVCEIVEDLRKQGLIEFDEDT
jgi:hypothetical protein